ncbi:MAG: exosome complex protein Rrp42 [Candidatus Hadarchaeota archaeon]
MEIASKVKRDYIISLAQQGKRADERALDQLREATVEKGVIKTANGSARVKLGKTHVLVGVKLGKGEPFPDTPDSGILMVNSELLPMAFPLFEPGPPKVEAIELARVVDRGIRESETIDLEKLSIKSGEEVWSVFIDIDVLDHDGNMLDAAALAAVAALLDVKPPEDEAWSQPEFPLRKKPVAVTVAKINGQLLVDPTFDEEQVMDARLTLITTEDGSICAMQKGGAGYFTKEEALQAYSLAREKAAEFRRLLG